MSAVLAVDLGKTSCRAALWQDEAPRRSDDARARSGIAQVSAGPDRTATGSGAPGLAAHGGVELAERAIGSVCRQVLGQVDPPEPLYICIGAAGALSSPAGTRALAGRLSALFPTGAIAICSDAVLAHAGALDGQPGLVLVMGTGSVVLGLGPPQAPDTDVVLEPELIQVDGWGPLLGDLGSGGWIGTAGLRAALRAYDGRGPGTDLEAAARAEFGEPATLPTRFADRGEAIRIAAGFAPIVAGLAAAGDMVSRQIMDDAGAHLAELVVAGWRRLQHPGPAESTSTARSGEPSEESVNADATGAEARAVVTGGLLELGAPLLEPLTSALAIAIPGLSLQPAAGTALDGARRLATDHHTVHEPFVYRAGTQDPRAGDQDSRAGNQDHRADDQDLPAVHTSIADGPAGPATANPTDPAEDRDRTVASHRAP